MIRAVVLGAAIAVAPLFAQADDLRIRKGLCEASAVARLDDNRIAVASDEIDELAVYGRADTTPIWTEDLGSVRDIEGAARIDDTVFWVTSHGLTKKGKDKPKRRKLLATRTGPQNLPVERGKKLDTLRQILTGALDRLDSSVMGGVDIPAKLDIEGMTATPKGALLVGLRAPLTADGHAVMVHVSKPFALLNLDQPSGGPDQNVAIAVDLGGRGIRGMTRDPAGTYINLAGPSGGDDATFALFRWTGSGSPKQITGIDLTGMLPEAVIAWETGLVEVFGDNGRTCSDEDTPEPDRWFPSRMVRY